jgi:hypothetical protein
MYGKKISQLPSALTSSGNDLYVLVQGGIDKSITFADLAAAIGGGGGGGVSSLNNLTGPLDLVAGSNITITPSGSNLIIATTSNAGITQLTGDVTATGPGVSVSTVVSVGGSSAANIHAAELLANAATSLDTYNTIVKRDSSGNFSANIITSALVGNVTGDLVGNVLGNVIGNIIGNVTGNVTGNVSGSAGSFTGSLVGDVTGTQGATVVSFVGGSSAANIHAAELLANGATSLDTPSTIVIRDASGNFSATNITSALTGTASGNTTYTPNDHGVIISGPGNVMTVIAPDASTTKILTSGGLNADPTWQAAPPSGINQLTGDVTAGPGAGSQVATVVSVGGSSAANIHTAELLANAATDANTPSTIVKRDANGNVILTSEEITGFIELDNASPPSTPATGKTKLYVDSTNSISRLRFVDSTGLVETIARDNYNLSVNNTGVTLNKGQLVYINGVVGSVATVALAEANSTSTSPAYGFVAETILNGASGRVQFTGTLSGIDTSLYTSGQILYLSTTVAGAFTGTKPVFPAISQTVAVVLTVGVSGNITITMRDSQGVSLGTSNIDGGSASSLYTTAQTITGGTP